MHGQENTGPLYIRDIRLEAMAQSHKIYTQAGYLELVSCLTSYLVFPITRLI